MNLPKRFIVSKRPKQYLKQGPSHCGVYCVKAILSAYGKDNEKAPQDYHIDWLRRKSPLSFTFGKHYYDKIFKKYGLHTETKSAEKLTDQERLIQLKLILVKNLPVMIRIGNGFIRNNRYNRILGRIIPHWITLWGYDDTQQTFHVYDSGLPKHYWRDKNLPIGNTTRTYNEILRDWKFGRWNPTAWNNSAENNLYVEIKK